MAGDLDEAMAEAEARAAGPDFVRGLAERVGATASARAVFGEPVERDGVTVIPVASTAWAFGGGGGTSPEGEGTGGGGGSVARPIGWIELRAGGAEFKPLRDPRRALVAAGGLALAGLAIARASRR